MVVHSVLKIKTGKTTKEVNDTKTDDDFVKSTRSAEFFLSLCCLNALEKNKTACFFWVKT